MIDIDIKNVETKIGYCLMSPIINAAIYYKRDYQISFAGCLFFGFEPFDAEKRRPFHERVNWDFASDLFPEELIKYHGIDVIRDNCPVFSDFKSKVESELAQGNPVVLTFDAYNAPWTYYYKRHHLMHFCLIVGVDKGSDSFFIIDPYITEQIQKFPFSEVEQSYYWHYKIRLFEPMVNIASVWEEILRRGIHENYENKYNKSSYQMMREFAREILDYNDIIEEIKIQNSTLSYQLFHKLKYISFSRLNYSWLLKYISEKFSIKEFAQMENLMVQVSNKWKLVFGQLTKICYIEQQETINRLKKNLSDQIVENSKIEEEVTQNILRVINGR